MLWQPEKIFKITYRIQKKILYGKYKKINTTVFGWYHVPDELGAWVKFIKIYLKKKPHIVYCKFKRHSDTMCFGMHDIFDSNKRQLSISFSVNLPISASLAWCRFQFIVMTYFSNFHYIFLVCVNAYVRQIFTHEFKYLTPYNCFLHNNINHE